MSEYRKKLLEEGKKYGWGFILIQKEPFYKFIEDLIDRFGRIRLLEVGCWRCLLYGHLKERYGDKVSYVGIDVIDLPDRIAECEFYLMNGESLLFPPESFHAVIYIETLEHIIDYVKSLREAYRVLIRGGGVFIQAPISTDHNAWLDETHHHILHPITLKRLLEHLGFTRVGYVEGSNFAIWGYK